MKAVNAAREVLRNLRMATGTNNRLLERAGECILEGNALAAYEHCRNSPGINYRHGWNKFWIGNVLYGWCGELVTSHSIRLVALEIESDESSADAIRSWLTARWTDAQDAELSQEVARLTVQLGLPQRTGTLTTPELRLLQRLNLDQRDRPFIERWRWSKQVGVAIISDGGRETIKPEAVWGRALEASLDENGRLVSSLAEALQSVPPDIEILQLPVLPEAEALISRLEFYGLGQRWVNGVKLSAPIPSGISRFIASLSSRL